MSAGFQQQKQVKLTMVLGCDASAPGKHNTCTDRGENTDSVHGQKDIPQS